jgi:CRP-like cAMP-binding protein
LTTRAWRAVASSDASRGAVVRWAVVRFRFPPDSPLHAFADDEVVAIFAAGSVRSVAAGQSILVESEPGDSMFFLVEGNAEAKLHSGKTVRTYGPGSYFGELSFINPGHRRSTTVVATTDATLHVLDQSSVAMLIAIIPGRSSRCSGVRAHSSWTRSATSSPISSDKTPSSRRRSRSSSSHALA